MGWRRPVLKAVVTGAASPCRNLPGCPTGPIFMAMTGGGGPYPVGAVREPSLALRPDSHPLPRLPAYGVPLYYVQMLRQAQRDASPMTRAPAARWKKRARRQSRFTRAFARGGTLRAASLAAGISTATALRWSRTDPSFRERLAGAWASFQDALQGRLLEDADVQAMAPRSAPSAGSSCRRNTVRSPGREPPSWTWPSGPWSPTGSAPPAGLLSAGTTGPRGHRR